MIVMKLKKNVAISESGVIFNAATGDSYSINPVAAKIVAMLKEGKSEEAIKSELINTYQVEDKRVDEDYYDFISHLKQLSLLETYE